MRTEAEMSCKLTFIFNSEKHGLFHFFFEFIDVIRNFCCIDNFFYDAKKKKT